MTNERKVLRYIAEHGSVSVREMTVELWIGSPTKVISEMKKKGIPVISWYVTDKHGNRFKRYGLKA